MPQYLVSMAGLRLSRPPNLLFHFAVFVRPIELSPLQRGMFSHSCSLLNLIHFVYAQKRA